MGKKIIICCIPSIIIILFTLVCVYKLNIINKKVYSNKDFNIQDYISNVDMDKDGIDDQTDMLQSVREYISTNPKYESRYYSTGYPNDEYGVCTDVIAFGMLGAGYDLMNLVNDDIEKNTNMYNIDVIDKNIDFRRVRNLKIYFKNNAISLTTDISKIEEWQGGDIVIFDDHIAVISDKRNEKGIPFIIHNANPFQSSYEEDVLEYMNDIVGHYRIS